MSPTTLHSETLTDRSKLRRYGYVITNRELVCVRAIDGGSYGDLEVSSPFPWAPGRSEIDHPDNDMTPLLALVALHLLASADDHWRMQGDTRKP
jgi:hypothetical protein